MFGMVKGLFWLMCKWCQNERSIEEIRREEVGCLYSF